MRTLFVGKPAQSIKERTEINCSMNIVLLGKGCEQMATMLFHFLFLVSIFNQLPVIYADGSVTVHCSAGQAHCKMYKDHITGLEGSPLAVEFEITGKKFTFIEILFDKKRVFYGYDDLEKKDLKIPHKFNFTSFLKDKVKDYTYKLRFSISKLSFDEHNGHELSYVADFRSSSGRTKGDRKLTVEGKTSDAIGQYPIYIIVAIVIFELLVRVITYWYSKYEPVPRDLKIWLYLTGIISYLCAFKGLDYMAYKQTIKWRSVFYNLVRFGLQIFHTALIAVGWAFIDKCPMEHLLPIYLIIAGFLGTLARLPLILMMFHIRDDAADDDDSTFKKIFKYLLKYSSFCHMVFNIFHFFGISCVFVNYRKYMRWENSEFVGCDSSIWQLALANSILFVLYFILFVPYLLIFVKNKANAANADEANAANNRLVNTNA